MERKASQAATRLAIRHYLGQVWLQRRYSFPAMLFAGIGNILVFYVPPLIVAATLKHFNEHPYSVDAFLPYLLMLAGAWLAGEGCWRFTFWAMMRTEKHAMHRLYIDALEELSKKHIGFFHDNFAGSLTRKAISYGRRFEGFFDTFIFNVFCNVLPMFFAAFILWQFSPWLVLILLGMMAVVLTIVIPLIRRRKKLVDIRESAGNVMAGHVADVISNMDAVQAFAHHKYELKRHNQNVNDYMKKMIRSWDYQNLRIDLAISPIYVMINVAGLALAVSLSHNISTLTTIFVTFSYYALVTRILWEFNHTYRNLETAIAEAAQFTEILLEPPLIQDPPQPKPFNVSKGAIEFKNVHFTYNHKAGASLFANLNLSIQPGEKVALVGHSGGGKTTITKLLLRFVDVTDGTLSIDHQNIIESRLEDVRKAIAYVPQEPVMFHRTIRDNIRYGNLAANDDAVVAAAKKANAHEFIMQLPDGYETLVGERGVKLSGGQRQRVAIARAIIKDAPILVLDEATSALDSESEKLIQAALWKLMESRTAVVIAHRLSTIQKMDRIVVLEAGKIVEEGTHQELLDSHGIYAQLWLHQSGGFLKEQSEENNGG